ncbi:MAK10-like protein [Tanacetum coccineum]
MLQNGCSFHGLRSEDPNQHLKDFLKLVDLLDLDVANRERTRLHLFQFSLRDQASNWLERFGAGSIFTWEDLTTHFLAQFFPPGRTEKLHNDILMFQQHHGKSISEAWTHFKDLLQNCEIDRAAGGKLNNKNADESWEIIEKLYLYNHEGWNDLKDCVKPVKAISTSQNTSKNLDQILLELEDQINFLQKDYMAAYTKRIERFENSILKQREEVNDKITKMFELLKELTANQTSKKVLIREEGRHPITKNVNSISIIQIKEEKKRRKNGLINKGVVEPIKSDEEEPPEGIDMKNEFERKADDEPAKSAREDVTKNEEEEPAGVSRRLKNMNALVDQGSDMNAMPFSIYNMLTDERHAETDIRLSLASHSYIYPLGIAEDVLVDVVGYVYPMDFVILDIKEDEKRPFILGTPFLTASKAVIKFDKGTITLRFGKSKMSFHRIPEPHCRIEKGIKNDIEPIAPTMTVNRLVLEWEEKIKLHQ